VRIAEFQGGLLHTKSVTVDGELSLFGSLNLDPRSLILNFEITLSIYDRAFTSLVAGAAAIVLERSTPMDRGAWRRRSFPRRVRRGHGAAAQSLALTRVDTRPDPARRTILMTPCAVAPEMDCPRAGISVQWTTRPHRCSRTIPATIQVPTLMRTSYLHDR
jgi:hypothetical protein